MRNVSTDALVLHVFDYRETSRIVRIATRDLGVVSVIARGAKRPTSKFGSAFDLFTSGLAHLSVRPMGDLHTLTGFDATRSRSNLAGSLQRFGAASALAELVLRFGQADDTGRVLEGAVSGLDAIGSCAPPNVAAAALSHMWRLIAELGFAPAVQSCASCHAPLANAADAVFHHRAGGALCANCARGAHGGRVLPAAARHVLTRWLDGREQPLDDAPSARAHRRLLREFLEEHLGDGRPLRAFASWEDLATRAVAPEAIAVCAEQS